MRTSRVVAGRASIVVTSYNYARYLPQTIDSALGQTYRDVEVIVVDDGSTDGSCSVIEGYGSRIIPVMKNNGGQASAFNAGFARSTGEFVLFLDSDDLLLPDTIERFVGLFREDKNITKVHWPLWIIDSEGMRTGAIKEGTLPEGDFRETVRRYGPMTEELLPSAPTSGNAYRRSFLDAVMPMPEFEYRICPDMYLFGMAPAFGIIRRFTSPQGCWRYHGRNASRTSSFEVKLQIGTVDAERQQKALRGYYQSRGTDVDFESWRDRPWWRRIRLSLDEMEALLPPGGVALTAGAESLGLEGDFCGRRYTEMYAPGDDVSAIAEVRRGRDSGARFLFILWPCFWWLDHYREFRDQLRRRYRRVLNNDRVIGFDLNQPA